MKKQRFIFILCLVLCGIYSINSQAQQGQSMYGEAAKVDVKMKYVYTYEEAVKRAKAEKKLIFFNCFADWALPCHSMNKAVFADQKFADYMDKTFVNLFIDVTSEAGRPFAEKYGISTFAHYLVLDADGNVVLRIVGGAKLPDFKEQVDLALSSKTSLAGTEAAYNAGERSKRLLCSYLYALYLSGQNDKYNQLSKGYVGMLSKKEYSQKKNWFIVRSMVQDRNSEMYTYMIEHRAEFEKNVGKETIAKYIEAVFTGELYQLASGSVPYDGNKMLEIFSAMQKVNIPDSCIAGLLYRMGKFRGEKKYIEFLDLVDAEGKLLGGYLPGLEMSFKFDDMTESQKQRLIVYLRKAAERYAGTTKQQFTVMADALEFNSGIKFEEKLTFQQALDKAKQENKLLFIDCYTSWCGPCKMMANNVFTQKEVGKYFNEHFINIKMDMEKGEGREISTRYKVMAFPTMMVIEPSGRIAWRMLGAQQADQLLKSVATVVGHLDRGYEISKEAYEKGERTATVMRNYIAAMKASTELNDEQAGKLLDELLTNMSDEQFCNADTWSLLDIAVKDIHGKDFNRMLKLHDALCKVNGDSVVNKKIEKEVFPYVIQYFKSEVNREEVLAVLNKIKQGQYPANYTLNILAELVPMYKTVTVQDVVNFYTKRVATIERTMDRLNLDMLLRYFAQDADELQRQNVEKYVAEALNGCDDYAKRGYAVLLGAIKELRND